jgi:oligoendopeptidase F
MSSVQVYSNRDEINEKYKWDLEAIYGTTELFNKDHSKVLGLLPSVGSYKGSLGQGTDRLLACLELNDMIMKIVYDLYVYAKMKRDENTKLAFAQELSDKADTINVKASVATSFIVPELTSLDGNILEKYIKDPLLKIYRHFLENIVRQKAHILTEAEERILSMSGEILSAPGDIFTMFDSADITFDKISDENGKKVRLTKGNYITFLQNKKRSVRKAAYKEIYKQYGAMENTLARILAVNTKADKLSVDLRGYSSCLEAALSQDNIKTDVYTSLISAIDSNQPLIDRYLRLRKKLLRVKELKMYDVYAPVIDCPEKKYSYEEAVEIVLKALAPLGTGYVDTLKNAFKDRWLDVYETEGKKSGAYSWGSYNSHPYVLLNFQGTIKDIFTIAHEMGHAMHSYNSNKTQEFVNSSYPIFLAEVASTTNEIILSEYLIKNCNDDKEKAYLLNNFLEEFRTTVFRQTMFAEFELLIHQAVENDIALTTDFIKDTYKRLVVKHFGNVVSIDGEIASEWSRIPHFYSSFYVYKYATGFCAAAAIAKNILDGVPGATGSYLEFLSGGGSDYPLEQLLKTGVDLSSTAPVLSAMKIFENTLQEMEDLI